MKIRIIVSISCLLLLISLLGCSGSSEANSTNSVPSPEKTGQAATLKATDVSNKYKDGTYEVKTEKDVEDYYTTAKLTIKGGKIVEVDWGIFDANRNDKPFDEKYEEVFAGQDEYIHQSRADWLGSRGYAPKLVELQDPQKVDAVSGATWTNKKFKEATELALKKAEK